MFESDPFDPDDYEDYFERFDIENTDICAQLWAERWIMEFVLTPAKTTRRRTIEHVVNAAYKRADVAGALAALERDGLIRLDGETVSATTAAVSFWRLGLEQPSAAG